MINTEVLYKLYEGVINNRELTTKELNSYGLNSKDLNVLIEEGKLERVKRGYYRFLAFNNLFKYGIELIRNGKVEEATKCFLKCYELEPNNKDVCFRLILMYILNEDYEEAFKYFEIIMSNANNHYARDNNLFLYLLCYITDIPQEYKEYVRTFKKSDLELHPDDRRYKGTHAHNKIRNAVFQDKFSYALKLFNEMHIKVKLNIQNQILKTLLKQAATAKDRAREVLLELAKTKKYKEIVDYLKEEERKHKLNNLDCSILIIAEQLTNIIDYGIYPENRGIESIGLFTNIDYGNYKAALQISNDYNERNNINCKEDVLNILLVDINNLIEKKELELSAKEEEEERIEITSTAEVNTNRSSTFQDVIKYLFNNDLGNTFKSLASYLKTINQSKYEFLVVNLIKLSLIEKDGAFTKPITLLSYLSRDSFTFDLSSYIQEFYITLSQNRLEEAKIYLDIIKNADKLGQEFLMVDNLSKALDNALKMDLSIVETPKEEVTTTDLSPSVSVVSDEENIIRDSERELIRKKHEFLLRAKGVVLLEPMDIKKCKRLIKISKEYLDLRAFIINDGSDTRVVLRYRPTLEEYLNVKELVANADKEYKTGNYKECIDALLQCLQVGKPSSYVYAKLGLSYLKNGNKNSAINYLVIATSLAEKDGRKFDFTNLIGVLRGDTKPEDEKPYVKMSLDEFTYDIDCYYGIQDVDKITTYILESGLDVESACIKLGMSKEEIDILRLIYARTYYTDGYFKKGDEFIKAVEKSQNKTKFVINLLNEIRSNKRFYMNRADNNTLKLSLALK